MASIYKRGPHWWISYTLNGKRVQKSLRGIKTRADAMTAKSILEAQIAQNPLSLMRADMTIERATTAHLDFVKQHRRPATFEIHRHHWTRFVAFLGPQVKVDLYQNIGSDFHRTITAEM